MGTASLKRVRSLLALLACSIFNGSALAQVPLVDDSNQVALSPDFLAALIDDLASPTYATRQSATDRLSLLGDSSIGLLDEALTKSNDLESKARLVSVISEIRGLRLKKALDAFRRDVDPANAHGLEAWPRLVEIIGDSRVAKLLMIEMYDAQPKLMRAIVGSDDALQQAALEAAKSMPERGRFPETGNGLALVFACIAAKKPIDLDVQIRAMQSVREYPLTQKFTDPRWKNDVRKLTGAWLEKMPIELARDGLVLSITYEIPNGIVLARQMLSNPNIDSSLFYFSIQVLARNGSMDDMELLEPWLSNETLLVETTKRLPSPVGIPSDEERFTPDSEIQRGRVLFQDAALAAAVVLSKQSLKDYFPDVEDSPKGDFNLQQIAVPLDKPNQRAFALERWKNYRNSNQPDQPKDPK